MELEDRIVCFAARCVKVCSALPTTAVGSGSLADQLFRSSTGIAANYAEACEAESAKDFVHKLKISMKELSETRVWLKLIGEVAKVVGDTEVEFEGKRMKLSPLTREIKIRQGRCNKSGAYQGAQYWKYEDTRLAELM